MWTAPVYVLGQGPHKKEKPQWTQTFTSALSDCLCILASMSSAPGPLPCPSAHYHVFSTVVEWFPTKYKPRNPFLPHMVFQQVFCGSHVWCSQHTHKLKLGKTTRQRIQNGRWYPDSPHFREQEQESLWLQTFETIQPTWILSYFCFPLNWYGITLPRYTRKYRKAE